LERRNHTCEEVKRLFERLIDGEIDAAAEQALKGHLASCEACRDLYALDLALIGSIRTSPEIAFESVASEVVGRVRARERKVSLARWGALVGAVWAIGFLTDVFGSSVYERLLGLFTGGLGSSPVFAALSRIAGVLIKLLEIAKSIAFGGALGSGVGAYAPQIAMLIIAAGALVIFMMYGMGVWLRKPREVRSWRRG
jgi:anti-sigma factor RsiW